MSIDMTNLFKRLIPLATSALLFASVSLSWSPVAVGQTRYTASWSSLDTHNPAPEWFQDAKFGIYYHWGAFGTAMYGDEWYPRNMMNKAGNSGAYQHHMATYGDPLGSWGYEKFLTGANDKSGKFTQFAPKLNSAGGAWDPAEWAQLFFDAGARFAGPVAEHHDGFSMWDSKVNEWNSVLLGPKLNLAKYHADAIRKKGLKLFMSMHHEWNFGGYWAYGTPATSDPSLQKLYGKLPDADEQTLWLNKLKEVIDEFLPDILYQDRYLSHITEANRLAFLAYYYNAALDKGADVIAVAKESITDHKGQLYDYERGGPADIRTPYWMTDDAVGSQSWCYVTGLSYASDAQYIGSFVDRISKGGNMILNISPMPDGSIPQRQKDILAAFGKFLRQMGTAIYNTRTFAVYGEGSTKMGGGEFTTPTALKTGDLRYTKSKDGDAVYALLGGWPGTGQVVNMTAVTTARFALGTGKVYLFGPTGGAAIELPATQDGSGLHVTLPNTQPYTAVMYAIKISKTGTVPGPTPWLDGTSTITDGGVPSTGGTTTIPDASTPPLDGSTNADGRADTASTGGIALGSGGNLSSKGGVVASGGSASSGGAIGMGGGLGTTGGATANGGATPATGGILATGGRGAGGTIATSGGTANSGRGGAGQGGASAGAVAGRVAMPTTTSSGCSCAIQGAGGKGPAGAFLLLGLAVASGLRRRRR